ncbi:MAG: cation transporter, partial [Bryobacteraceae bacterium]
HIWSLGSKTHALSCHVLISDMATSESNPILKNINDLLCKYQIFHTTIQFEHIKCALSEAPCSILVSSPEHEHHH